ncbi:MAG: hypothetical protein KF841_12250 [Phycisphaerae bacterium]|nr:hypothetical protein [Phycisphaerae bacterium]
MNLAIADSPGEQTQSKIRSTADGGAYISWFDNRSGGYDVYLQRIDKNGVEQWQHNGILIADRNFSSTQDYGLAVDADGNALITYRDDRFGGTQIGANLVSSDGTLLWGANGVTLTSSANGNAPKCVVLSDGTYAIGWTGATSPASVVVQRLNSGGVEQWSPPVSLSEASRPFNLSDICDGSDGSVILLWVRCSGTNCVTSNKHLYAQKLASDGSPSWNSGSPVIVFNTTSLQTANFPTMVADGSGGTVTSWYETGGSRNAYVQHLDADGNSLFPAPGSVVNTTAGVYRISAWADYDRTTGETVAVWTQSNTTQSMWGLSAQKFDETGTRLWGDGGVELLPMSTNQSSFARVVSYAGGAIASAFDARSVTTGVVIAARLDSDGSPLWAGTAIEACSVESGKSRLDAAQNGCDLLLTWGDSRFDARDIFIQNVKANGSLGPTVPAPGDMNCSETIDLNDIEPFVTAVLNANAYNAQFPCCNIAAADMNEDLLVNGVDIALFAAALIGN